jgi:hypothetical protein
MYKAFACVIAILVVAPSANAATVSTVGLSIDPSSGVVSYGTSAVPVYADYGSGQSFVTNGFVNTFTDSGTFAPITISQQCCGSTSFLDVAVNFTTPLSVPLPLGGAAWQSSQIVTLTLSGPNVPAWNPLSFNYGSINLLVNQLQPFTGGGFAGAGGALVASNYPITFGTPGSVPISELSANYYLSSNSPSGSLTLDQFTLSVQNVATTPLPASWGMMVLGLGVVGYLAYRRMRVRSVLKTA